ncbi:MAG TPA: ATP-binding protein [Thermomicrobiales bacterium]|nr:ATP-binding protein [Thermomicrobiales bacterium]
MSGDGEGCGDLGGDADLAVAGGEAAAVVVVALIGQRGEGVGAAPAIEIAGEAARPLGSARIGGAASADARQEGKAGVAVRQDEVFAGGGEMGALMRARDWAATPLGPVEDWPQSLQTAVRIMLNSRYPMFIWWGRELANLYNDAYMPFLGKRHPQALGRPAAAIWAEIWATVGPQTDIVLNEGRATWNEELLLLMERNEFLEETYFTFSYSPIPAAHGGVGGVFCACNEDTHRVLGQRRLKTLQRLGSRSTGEARTAEHACAVAAAILETNQNDLPFALLYLLDGQGTRAALAGAVRLGAGTPASPDAVALADAAAAWPLRAVAETGRGVLVDDLPRRFGPLPGGAWPESPRRAFVLPMAKPGQTTPAGFLIAGLSPRLAFDEDYRGFLELAAGQIGAAIANARAYEEERRRAEALAELDRAKTVFFSNVSHEFRTPLALSLGPVEDALADAAHPLPAAQRERLEIVQRNHLRLLKLVNSLLDFSRLEAGRIQASYEPTDLAATTAELASVFRSAIERAGLRLVVACPPLPAPVYVDRDMWEKIVLNLLSNAFKFTFEGEIRVALRDLGAAVELEVRDTGVGIPEAELPRLFERFHRVEATQARTYEGSGIGLALVQELARLHGGAVRAASALGEGSAFTVNIPTGTAHLPAERIQAPLTLQATGLGAAPFVEEALRWLPGAGDVAGAAPDGAAAWAPAIPEGPAGGRVLLADDNADMREYVARLLGERYAVEAVADGAAALAAARARPPDLVLADVMMPRLDGFGLLRALRADPRTADLPVVLLSARAGEESRVEGLDAGADDYLVKPFAARELLARVGTHVTLARMRAAARHAERAESERLRELFEQAPAAIGVLHGPDHVYTVANPRYLALIGRQPAEVLGKPLRAVFPEIEGHGLVELVEGVYRTGQTFVNDALPAWVDLDRDGVPEERYFNLVFVPLRGADGAPEGIFVHAYDVTGQVRARRALEAEVAERERAEARLVAERAVLELVARGMPLGETLAALARAIEAELDGALCSILRLDRGGTHLRHGAAPSLPGTYNRAIDGIAIGPAAASCGTAAYRGVPVIVADIATSPLWADYRELALTHGLRACWSRPIRGADGRVLGTFAVYRRAPRRPDRREQELVDALSYLAAIALARAANEEQREESLAREQAARAAAEAAVRARDEFLSIAAHELRTPVAAIKGTAQLALRRRERGALDQARAEQALRVVDRAVVRLAALIDDLLDVSRLRGGQLALRTARLDLAALVREAVDEYAAQLDAAHRLAVDLPAAPVPVAADAGRLEQVLDNLLGNAVKYSPGGGEIAVALAPDAGGATVAVRDSGIGLPAGAAERIFEPFGRAANAAASHLPGMGLGLHISRRIVELHGGRLWAESAGEGRGTTLRLWLPAAPVHEQGEEPGG